MEAVRETAFKAYGVCILLTHAAEFEDAIRTVLPPLWEPCPPDAASAHFTLKRHGDGGVAVGVDGEELITTASLDLALWVLDPQVRAHIALLAPDFIFVHAGAVAVGGAGVVLPGRSFVGKTTLVAELVRRGAEYYSDEYAVLDAEGFLNPYAKPLSLRVDGAQTAGLVSAEDLGGTSGRARIPVRCIVSTSYRPDAIWSPSRENPGAAALTLLSNTIPARTRPSETLQAVRGAAQDAIAVTSERGDSAEVAQAILDLVE